VLSKYRGLPYDVRFYRGRNLTIRKIKRLAAAYFHRTGRWPRVSSGPLQPGSRETWTGVDLALRCGFRGLPGGTSLAKVLGKKPGTVRNIHRPRLTVRQILSWADAYHQRTGRWPRSSPEAIPESPGDTWYAVDSAAKHGIRGMPGGTTIRRLLAQYRGQHFARFNRTPLTIEQILAWADAYHGRYGRWPNRFSGRVANTRSEIWGALNSALRSGTRGLPGGLTLADVLSLHRGVRNMHRLPKMTESQILRWAEAYHRRTGTWPTRDSGPIPEVPGETWSNVFSAMHSGDRGLSGRISLSGLLARQFGVRRPFHTPKLTLRQVRYWAEAHYRRTGHWPSVKSGAIVEAPGETWAGVNSSLNMARRGIPVATTLSRLRQGLRARSEGKRLARPLTEREILSWAKAYCRRSGDWPDQYSGRIADARGEVWFEVDKALRDGTRGLPGGSSLKNLLKGKRKPKPLVRPHSTRRVRPQ
jgi:hypothetical protein